MEPTPEEAAEGSILVKVLAAVLDRLVKSNNSIARSDPGQVTKFHALKAPGIGVEAYLERVHKYASCSNECFILALIYIDRLIERNNFLLTELNVHRVVITATLLAAKFFDDAYYNNAYYAKVGGVLVSELNGLEVDFLFRINFSLHASPEVFKKYKAELVAHSINSGLSTSHLSSVPFKLPHILEVESGSSSASSSVVTTPEPARRHQQHIQQTTSIPSHELENTAVNHDSIMTVPQEVIPSPSTSSQDVVSMVQNIGVGPLPNLSIKPTVNAVAEETTTPRTDQLNSTATFTAAAFQPVHVPITASKPYPLQQQLDQSSLQRANSLPHRRCIDHGFKLPYSAPPMLDAVPTAMTVDQQHYQLMMDQLLYPFENNLVRHGHEITGTLASVSIPDHRYHSNAAMGLIGHHHHAGGSHHPGLQGTGLMAYQVSWSGQIR